jgi:hypothetical protein
MRIRLEDPPAWMTVDLTPIRVPARLCSPHPAISALAADHEHLKLTGALRSRALRLLQALSAEAEARGYHVEPIRNNSGHQRPDRHAGLLAISILGHPIALDLAQQYDRKAHEPTAAELRRAERESWFRIPAHDHLPSARIEISVIGGREYRQSRWSDLAAPLEASLPRSCRRQNSVPPSRKNSGSKQNVSEQSGSVRESAMNRAKVRLRDTHRADVLMRQLDNWTRATQLDRYLTAAEAVVSEMATGEAESAARQWLDWAYTYRQQLNPLNRQLAMPEDPEPTADNLKPFLGSWSFYGPYDSYRY